MSLRPRQQKAVDDLVVAYQGGKRAPILVASTGFGKTHAATKIIRRSLAKGKRVWFLAHLDSILKATARKLVEEDIPYAWIAAGMPGDRRQAVQIVSVMTLVQRLAMHEPPEFLIVDEAHLAVADSYQRIFEWAKAGPKYWKPGGSHLLHLTATPQRLDGRGMAEVADAIIKTCSTAQLIAENLLAPIRYFEPTALGPDGKKVVVGQPIDHYRKHAHGRPAIGFCVSVQEAQANAALFAKAGYRTLAIDGDSDPVLRDAAEAGINSGALDIVFNCKLWTAGIDVPAVSCILDMRPTDSLVNYLQGLGRGLRTHNGKDDLVYLDCVGNRGRHGDPTAERAWSLGSAAQGSGRVASEAPTKTCPKCFSTVPALMAKCRCGHAFVAAGRKLQYIDGELREIDPKAVEAAASAKRQVQGRAETLQDLIAVGHARKIRRPEMWARAVMRGRARA